MIKKNEVIKTRYLDKKGNEVFVITYKSFADMYYIYKKENGDFKKLGKGKSPLELEKQYKVISEIGS